MDIEADVCLRLPRWDADLAGTRGRRVVSFSSTEVLVEGAGKGAFVMLLSRGNRILRVGVASLAFAPDGPAEAAAGAAGALGGGVASLAGGLGAGAFLLTDVLALESVPASGGCAALALSEIPKVSSSGLVLPPLAGTGDFRFRCCRTLFGRAEKELRDA